MKLIYPFTFKDFFAAMSFAVLGALAGNAQAASDYFLKIDGILGESTDKAHKDWIDIGSFSWGLGSSVGGKSAFSPFSWTQQIDKSVVPLFTGVASGDIFKSATLDVQKANTGGAPTVFFQMKFDNVHLSKLNFSGAGGTENVAAALDAYTRVTMTYKQQLANGSYGPAIIGGWDLVGSGSTFFGSPLVLEGLVLSEPSNSPVPVPAAAWLMGSGLLGLMGVARRKAA